MDTAGLQALEFVKVVSLNGFQLNFVLTSCPDEKFSVVLPEGRRLAAHPERLGGWERDLGGLTRAVECLALNWSLRPVHILTPTSATPLVPGPHAHPTCRLMADLYGVLLLLLLLQPLCIGDSDALHSLASWAPSQVGGNFTCGH
eukprot:RCo016394